MESRNAYDGPALLEMGFRPFFLAALAFAPVVIPVWWLVWRGDLFLNAPFLPADWHMHEMVFGYGAAVIAGFLFTAVPNWTGRMPKRGWPLAALAALWLAGRIAVAGVLPVGALAVALVDCAFLFCIGTVFAVEIVAGRNWRNLKVVVPVGLLLIANAVFHAEVMTGGQAVTGARLGLAVTVFLIMLIGGRIVPSFTRNWLSARGAGRMPARSSRLDAVSVAVGAAALLCWSLLPDTATAGLFLLAAGALHLWRLARWRGLATWRSPLLLMLHVAYLFVPLGLIALAAEAFRTPAATSGVHLLGIGAVGGMTLAVMARATRGHTGRDLTAGVPLILSFGCVIAAALSRALLGGWQIGGIDGITLAAALWTGGFAVAFVRIFPWVTRPAPGRRSARARPAQPPSPSEAR